MVYPNGTMVQVTELQEKDYDWLDGQFEEYSALVNGKKGKILKHFPASVGFAERESYLVQIRTEKGVKKLELELDEFMVVEKGK